MIRLLVFCLCVGINSFAQRNQANFWNEAGIDYSISKRNYTSLSFSSRWDDYGCYKLFPEVSLGREILEGFKFELDYRFIKNREEFGLYSNSNRWNFNLKYGHKWNRIKINIRIRYQFGQAGSLNQNYDSDFDNAWRLKPQLSYKKKKSKFTYSAGLETFYNPQFGPVGRQFNKIRSSIGLDYKLAGQQTLIAGFNYDKYINAFDKSNRMVFKIGYNYNIKKSAKKTNSEK